jgi:hypothetical protein
MAGRALSRIISGKVMHKRHLPVVNQFVYPLFSVLLKMDELEKTESWLFGVNRWRPMAFYFSDHGNGDDTQDWILTLLDSNGIHDCTGSIWLQTFPRVFGFVFNPVSFWYCERDDGSVGVIVAEVNNTFGDRHCYVLKPDPVTGSYSDISTDKKMYVSPFYPVEGCYRFYFNIDFDQPRVRIDYFNKGELQLNTTIWGRSKDWSIRSLLMVLLRQPLLTLGVVARIHWQALRLWIKGVSLFNRHATSTEEVSR